MSGKIKALGLAFAAVAAVSTMSSSAAHAGSFDIGAQPAILSGHDEENQNHVFSLEETDGGSGSAVCQTAWLEATTQGQSGVTDVTATATYGGQCLFAGLAAQVRLNGCKYTFTGAGQPANEGVTDIVGCTNATTGITITVPSCQLRIPQQNGVVPWVLIGIIPLFIVSRLLFTQAPFTVHQSGLACPDGNGHKGQNAALEGSTIIKATEENGSSQVTEHGHQFSKFSTSGTQVSVQPT